MDIEKWQVMWQALLIIFIFICLSGYAVFSAKQKQWYYKNGFHLVIDKQGYNQWEKNPLQK